MSLQAIPRIFVFSALLFVAAQPAQSQQSAQPDSSRLIGKISFEGDRVFTPTELLLRIRARPNRELLGIPGFRWWLWLHSLQDNGRIGRALSRSGEPPAYVDLDLLDADRERLYRFYLQEGYRQASVEYDIRGVEGSRWVEVAFVIQAGRPTAVREVEYSGIADLPEDVRDAITANIDLPPGRSSTLAIEGERYSEPKLLAERSRVLSLLLNNGYASVNRDSIRAIIIPAIRDSFDIDFRIRPGRQYYFGDTEYNVTGPEAEAISRVDSVSTSQVGDVVATFSGDSRLKYSLLERATRFAPGELYDYSKVIDTKKRLEATGTFLYTSIDPQRVDTLNSELYLAHRIRLATRSRHRMRFETFMLQRGGVLGGADTELGTGIGVSYRNANLLGGGESFQLRLAGSIAANSDFKLFTSSQVEVSTSLQYPYLVWPFGPLNDRLGLYNASSRWSLSLLTARRDELKLIVRGRGNMRLRLNMQHSPTVSSLVDVIDVSISNPDTLDGFASSFLDPLLASIEGDPVQRAQIIEDYTRPQVNNALRYTLRSVTVNPLRRKNGYSREMSVELGGTVPSILDRTVFTPSTVEGSLPGLPFFGGNTSRLNYRPYARLVGDYRWYEPVNSWNVVAWKAFVGYSHPTGGSDLVPFDRRFFSGGAFSVRGWSLGELGPGPIDLLSESTANEQANILGGDLKLESSVELRSSLLRNVLAAEWIFATFVDAGNIWFGPRNPGFQTENEDDPTGRFNFATAYKEIGVGTGFGLRIAWEYFIARLDLAYKGYDPSRQAEGFFPGGLGDPTLHFGIGHSF